MKGGIGMRGGVRGGGEEWDEGERRAKGRDGSEVRGQGRGWKEVCGRRCEAVGGFMLVGL